MGKACLLAEFAFDLGFLRVIMVGRCFQGEERLARARGHDGTTLRRDIKDGEQCSFVTPLHVSDSCSFWLIYRFTSDLITSET